MVVPLPQAQHEMFVFQHARLDRGLHFAREEHRLRIPGTERLQSFMPLEQVPVQLRQRQLVVEVDARLELIVS
jgi:hypothetical protein